MQEAIWRVHGSLVPDVTTNAFRKNPYLQNIDRQQLTEFGCTLEQFEQISPFVDRKSKYSSLDSIGWNLAPDSIDGEDAERLLPRVT